MTILNINYPVKEIAISLVDYAPLASKAERVLAGDIVACRNKNEGIGTKEAHTFLWLRIEGLEESEFAKLTKVVSTPGSIYDKRRYCIPLERLKEIVPHFDIDLAKNTSVIYQPFLSIDEDIYVFLVEDSNQPLQVSGLVYDKVTGDYL